MVEERCALKTILCIGLSRTMKQYGERNTEFAGRMGRTARSGARVVRCTCPVLTPGLTHARSPLIRLYSHMASVSPIPAHPSSCCSRYDKNEEVIAFVAVIEDVTSTYDAKVERDQLRAEHKAVSKANKLKDEFISCISHELRTPISKCDCPLSRVGGRCCVCPCQHQLTPYLRRSCGRV